MRHLLALLLLAGAAMGQGSGTATMALFDGSPTGTCNPRQFGLNQSTGALYTCSNGAWVAVTSAGGLGTVTSFSSGNLPTLFTTSVTTPTTTPSLSFTFLNAPAGTMLGNSGSSPAAPSWITIPTGGGGTGSLNGCSTPTSGNLVCDNSVTGGTGTVGLLQLPFASTGLPAPPTGAQAAIAADATGALYSSTGNGAAFQPLASGSGGGSTGPNISFPAPCNSVGYNGTTGSCADLLSNIQNTTQYTVAGTDVNHVILHGVSGVVTDSLGPPTGAFAAPFVFWVDTVCTSTVNVVTSGSTLINGQSNLQIGPCGWAMIWADTDGVSWHAQTYNPPGGVTIVQ